MYSPSPLVKNECRHVSSAVQTVPLPQSSCPVVRLSGCLSCPAIPFPTRCPAQSRARDRGRERAPGGGEGEGRRAATVGTWCRHSRRHRRQSGCRRRRRRCQAGPSRGSAAQERSQASSQGRLVLGECGQKWRVTKAGLELFPGKKLSSIKVCICLMKSSFPKAASPPFPLPA